MEEARKMKELSMVECTVSDDRFEEALAMLAIFAEEFVSFV
jgi:hypothetical protein